ncbi:hypothetical protein DFQ28_008839, partial [Apophysomyces sp. BC1034]
MTGCGSSAATRQAAREAQYVPESNILQPDGGLREGNYDQTNLFKAFPNDTAFLPLSEMIGEGLKQNILLKARKTWYQDCSGEMCMAPSSMYMPDMVTEIANGTSVDFRKNIVFNFKDRYCDYIGLCLKEVAQVPVGWPTPAGGFIQDIIDSVRDRVRHVATEEQRPRFQYIAEANIREQVNKFVTNMVNRYKTSIETFDGDRCRLEVENHATVPLGWPRNRKKLVVALFQRIWGISVELGVAGADQEDLEEHDQEQEQEREAAGDVLAGLPNNVHMQIENFITTERNLQVKGIRVSEVNLSECLGETGRRGTNGGDNDEENGDEDEVFHRTHGSKLSNAKAARLVPFLIYFLERREGNPQSFVLCPLQAHHRIALPFNVSFATTLLTHMEHFSRPTIEQLGQELQAGPNEQRAHQLTR